MVLITWMLAEIVFTEPSALPKSRCWPSQRPVSVMPMLPPEPMCRFTDSPVS